MQSQKLEANVHRQMRRLVVERFRLQRLVVGVLAAIGAVSTEATFLSVQAASLTKWSFDPAANQLEITVKDGTTPRYFLMAQPARIVLDLPDTAVGAVSTQQTYSGAVRQIRVSQFEPGLTRIVMEISPGVSLAPGQVKLQKMGNETAPASSSRWVLQPLITKSPPANTVAIKPSVPTQSRAPVIPSGAGTPGASTPGASAAKPLVETLPIIPSAPSTTPSPKPSIAPSQVATSRNKVPSPPTESNVPAIASNPVTAGKPVSKPTVVVPDIATVPSPMVPSATPTTTVPTASPAVSVTAPSASPAPTALAPVLPSPPSTAPTITPLPPTAVSPVDPNVAVDTQGGVAIAVPAPNTLSPAQEALPQPLAAATQTASPLPRSGARTEPSRGDRSPVTAKPATAPAAVSAARSTNPPLVQPPPAAASRLAAAEIPTTLVMSTATPPPTVSVPPLNVSTATTALPSTSEAPASKSPDRQPAVAVDMPSDGPSASASTQPSVSVPPPIQVGTASLGTATGTLSTIEGAPSMSVFDPNVPLVPPVAVPPLQQAPPLQPPAIPTIPQPGSTQTSYDANTIRQPTSSANLAPPLNLAPLQGPLQSPATAAAAAPGYDANTIRQPPTTGTPTAIVEFGQPLPAKASTEKASQPFDGLAASQGVRQAFKPAAPNVLLPAGTLLNLRYPGDSTLMVPTDRPQQEVLVLLTDLRDASGRLLAPAGSAVTGRFETTTTGSQFVTQSIALDGRSIPLAAQSESLDGSRKVEGNNLARNSGIGVLAGGVLGALSGSAGLGALGGAAAGAAATLLTAPKPAAIQPGQVVQVRLTQDLRSSQ